MALARRSRARAHIRTRRQTHTQTNARARTCTHTRAALGIGAVYEADADSASLSRVSIADWLRGADAARALRLRASGRALPAAPVTVGGNGTWAIVAFQSDASVEDGLGFAIEYCALTRQPTAPPQENATQAGTHG